MAGDEESWDRVSGYCLGIVQERSRDTISDQGCIHVIENSTGMVPGHHILEIRRLHWAGQGRGQDE